MPGNTTARPALLASSSDIEDVLGAKDESVVLEILNLRPTVRELEEATTWLSGDRDVFGAAPPPNEIVSRIVAILSAGDDEEDAHSP